MTDGSGICPQYTGAPLQIIDLPGIIEGAKDGRGRGRQVIAVAKTCHLIFIVLDVNKPLTDKRVIEAELEGFGVRINKEPPNITFKKKDKGGLNITSTVPLTQIDNDEIRAVMSEYRINSADITIRCDASVDDIIDVLEARSRRYVQSFIGCHLAGPSWSKTSMCPPADDSRDQHLLV